MAALIHPGQFNTRIGIGLAVVTLLFLVMDFSGRLVVSSEENARTTSTPGELRLTKQLLTTEEAAELKALFAIPQTEPAEVTPNSEQPTEEPLTTTDPRLVQVGNYSLLLRAVIRDANLQDSSLVALVEVENKEDGNKELRRLADGALLLEYTVRIESNLVVRLINDSKPDIALLMYDDKSR